MVEKHALIIEADTTFANLLSDSLEKAGFTVEIAQDGALGLIRAKEAPPNLIVLCVELPKMSGYAVCNKLKKSNTLRSIPLIITSSEATPETFEQHRKLKTRADEYLLKTPDLDLREFESKVNSLVVPTDTQVGAEPSSLEITPISSIAFSTEDVFGSSESTRVDSNLVAKVNASFLLERSSERDESADDLIEEEVLAEDPFFADPQTPVETVAEDDGPPDLGLDEIAQAAAVEASGPQGTDRRVLEAEVRRLQEERDKLAAELQSGRFSGSADSSRDREFLALRELINHKEKEILDQKDLLTRKDRELLSATEEMQILKRQKQELENRIIAVEKERVEDADCIAKHNATIGELQISTQELKETLARSEAELTRLQGQAAQDSAQYQTSLSTQQESSQKELQDLRQTHAQELQRQKDDHQITLSQTKEEHLRALEQLEESKKQALALLEQEKKEALDAAEQQKNEALRAAEESKNQALAAAENERLQVTEKLRLAEEAHGLAVQKAQSELDEARALHRQDQNNWTREKKELEVELQESRAEAESIKHLLLKTQRSLEAEEKKNGEQATQMESLRGSMADLENRKRLAQAESDVDRDTVMKIRKALLVALTILEDRFVADDGTEPSS